MEKKVKGGKKIIKGGKKMVSVRIAWEASKSNFGSPPSLREKMISSLRNICNFYAERLGVHFPASCSPAESIPERTDWLL